MFVIDDNDVQASYNSKSYSMKVDFISQIGDQDNFARAKAPVFQKIKYINTVYRLSVLLASSYPPKTSTAVSMYNGALASAKITTVADRTRCASSPFPPPLLLGHPSVQ